MMSSAPSAIRISAWTAAAILAFGMAGCSTSASQQKTEEPPSIVWPGPPDPPRVKFVEVFRSNRDVEGRTRRNFKEILFGIEPDRLAVTLKRPMDIATDSQGRILVVDSANPGIHVYDKRNHKFEQWGTKGEGTLVWPMAVDVDDLDCAYVTDHKQKRVFKYDRNGAFIYALKDFENPVGLAVDAGRKRFFVVDSKAHLVKVFSLDGQLLETVGEHGVEEGQFNFPTYCAVDAEGNLYVTDTGNFRVQVFSPSFDVEGSFGAIGNSPGQFTRPKGIAVDRHGIIYVVDGAFNNLQMFDREFRLLMPVGETGREAGKFELPVGIHVDARDTIYLADFGNSRVQVLQLLSDGIEAEEPVKKKLKPPPSSPEPRPAPAPDAPDPPQVPPPVPLAPSPATIAPAAPPPPPPAQPSPDAQPAAAIDAPRPTAVSPEPPIPAALSVAPAKEPSSLAERANAHLAERKSHAAGRYTLQLMLACRPENVEKMLQAQGAGDTMWFIPHTYQGKPCYKVFWGDYASIAEAEAARASLPSSVAASLPKVPVVSMEKAFR